MSREGFRLLELQLRISNKNSCFTFLIFLWLILFCVGDLFLCVFYFVVRHFILCLQAARAENLVDGLPRAVRSDHSFLFEALHVAHCLMLRTVAGLAAIEFLADDEKPVGPVVGGFDQQLLPHGLIYASASFRGLLGCCVAI